MHKVSDLFKAAKEGNAEAIYQAIQSGKNLHVTDEAGQTLLHHSAYYGHLSCVEILIQYGVKAEARCLSGHTAFLMAATMGHQDCMNVLLSNQKGVRP